LLDAAGTPMKAMILLGINCAFGQTDVANLPRSAIDLNDGWINFPRPKTAIPRRCPIWPETIAALKEAIADRPEAKSKDDAGLVFITKYGKRWVRVREREGKAAVAIDSVRLEFEKLLVALSLKRPRVGFYSLRHAFRTVADSSKDVPVIDCVMGHTRDDMATLYRERIDDERFRPVLKIVHDWLFAEAAKPPKNAPAPDLGQTAVTK
jgi:integrase